MSFRNIFLLLDPLRMYRYQACFSMNMSVKHLLVNRLLYSIRVCSFVTSLTIPSFFLVMDSTLAILFLDYSRSKSFLKCTDADNWGNTVTGLTYRNPDPSDALPIPFPTEVPPAELYFWFKNIVNDWLIDRFWSPTLDIPEVDYQRLFCHYLTSCVKS